jgi:hypothetical protein
VLFSPAVVPIVDIFRVLGDFEDHYDVFTLDRLEHSLTSWMGPDAAKGTVSDALLLAFGLRRERHSGLDLAPLQSRRGTLDEYKLITLIEAAMREDSDLAARAAAALGVFHVESLVPLAAGIGRRLRAAGLRLEQLDGRLIEEQLDHGRPDVEVERYFPGDRAITFDS